MPPHGVGDRPYPTKIDLENRNWVVELAKENLVLRERSSFTLSASIYHDAPQEYGAPFTVRWYPMSEELAAKNLIEIVLLQNGKVIGTINPKPIPVDQSFEWDTKTYYTADTSKLAHLDVSDEYALQVLQFNPDGTLFNMTGEGKFSLVSFDRLEGNLKSGAAGFVLERSFETGKEDPYRRHVFTYYDPVHKKEYRLLERPLIYQATLIGTELMFINSQHEVESHDLANGASSIIVKGPVMHYLRAGNSLYYVNCKFDADIIEKPCPLQRYTRSTGIDEELVKDLKEHIKPVKYGGYRVINYRSDINILDIATIGGDAGVSWGKLYRFDLASKIFVFVGESWLDGCPEGCSEEVEKENEKFYRLFPTQPKISCGGFEPSFDRRHVEVIGCASI